MMNMRLLYRHLITLTLVVFSALMVKAENLTVKTLFAEMPDEVIPYLTKTNRLDCIDFMESNMKAEVRRLIEYEAERSLSH